jgi:hypothetical protein
MRNEISNTENILDSREIIARIEELESERDALAADVADAQTAVDEYESASSDAEDAGEDAPDLGTLQVDLDERANVLADWNTSEEAGELVNLKALADQAEGYGDWAHGETLISEDYFTEYCEEMVSDIGDMPKEIPSYIVIDWEATADNLKADYMELDFDGQTYLMRA